jgi:hypothetical protein
MLGALGRGMGWLFGQTAGAAIGGLAGGLVGTKGRKSWNPIYQLSRGIGKTVNAVAKGTVGAAAKGLGRGLVGGKSKAATLNPFYHASRLAGATARYGAAAGAVTGAGATLGTAAVGTLGAIKATKTAVKGTIGVVTKDLPVMKNLLFKKDKLGHHFGNAFLGAKLRAGPELLIAAGATAYYAAKTNDEYESMLRVEATPGEIPIRSGDAAGSNYPMQADGNLTLALSKMRHG